MNVLIDTSVWSLALRKKNHSNEEVAIANKLKELILEYRVRIIGPIRQELLSGISSSDSFSLLKLHLDSFEDLEITSLDYVRAAEMYNTCRMKGIQGSHIDFLICGIAERYHLSIFTLDRDFDLYAKYLPLVLYHKQ